MRKAAFPLIACGAAALVLASACTDVSRSLSPVRDGSVPDRGLIGTLLSSVTSLLIAPVERTTPLANDVSWTFTAGPDGAVSTNSAVGLTVKIPAGALSSTQQITVTALAGAPVAYAFEPHLVFSRKVSLTQNLRGTTAGSLLSLPMLSGAHFDGDRLELNSDGLAIVTEVVAAVTNLLARTAKFDVTHFSGWILGSGRVQSDDDGE